MSESNAQIIRSIGALEEAVKNLANVAIRMDDKALEERHAIYERIDDLASEVMKIASKVDVQQSKLDKIAPTIEKFEESYQRSIGAKHLGKFIWGIIISILTVGIAAIGQILNWWQHHAILPPGLH